MVGSHPFPRRGAARAVGLASAVACSVILFSLSAACGGASAPAEAEPPPATAAEGGATSTTAESVTETTPAATASTDAETAAPAETADAEGTEQASTAQALTREESEWLDAAQSVLATHFEDAYLGSPPDLEGELGETVDAGLTEDFLGYQFSSGDISFVLPLTAQFCRDELAAAGPAPTVRLKEIRRLIHDACIQLERALTRIGFVYGDPGELLSEPDYPAAVKALRRANRLAEQATEALYALEFG